MRLLVDEQEINDCCRDWKARYGGGDPFVTSDSISSGDRLVMGWYARKPVLTLPVGWLWRGERVCIEAP